MCIIEKHLLCGTELDELFYYVVVAPDDMEAVYFPVMKYVSRYPLYKVVLCWTN